MAQPEDVSKDQAAGRYELEVDGEVAFTAFQKRGDTVVFTHTEVPQDERGQGVGETLIKGALQQVRDAGLEVIPLCPFVDAYIRRHPEEQDLLAERERGG